MKKSPESKSSSKYPRLLRGALAAICMAGAPAALADTVGQLNTPNRSDHRHAEQNADDTNKWECAGHIGATSEHRYRGEKVGAHAYASGDCTHDWVGGEFGAHIVGGMPDNLNNPWGRIGVANTVDLVEWDNAGFTGSVGGRTGGNPGDYTLEAFATFAGYTELPAEFGEIFRFGRLAISNILTAKGAAFFEPSLSLNGGDSGLALKFGAGFGYAKEVGGAEKAHKNALDVSPETITEVIGANASQHAENQRSLEFHQANWSVSMPVHVTENFVPTIGVGAVFSKKEITPFGYINIPLGEQHAHPTAHKEALSEEEEEDGGEL